MKKVKLVKISDTKLQGLRCSTLCQPVAEYQGISKKEASRDIVCLDVFVTFRI